MDLLILQNIDGFSKNDLEDALDILIFANPHLTKNELFFGLIKIFKKPNSLVSVLKNEDRQLCGISCAYIENNIFTLDDIALQPLFRGLKFGDMLWNHNIKWATDNRADIIKLEVHYKCFEAVKWYYKKGLRGSKFILNHFGENQDALLMEGILTATK